MIHNNTMETKCKLFLNIFFNYLKYATCVNHRDIKTLRSGAVNFI